MTLEELVSEVRKSLEGSISSSDSRFNSRYLRWLVPQLTSKVIVDSYTGTRTKKATKLIDPDSYYIFPNGVTKVAADQSTDNQYTVFELGASPVVFDDSTNGLILQNRNATGTFVQAKSLGHLQMLQAKGYRDGSTLYYLALGTQVRIYGSKAIKTIFPALIPNNVLDITGFDSDNDRFPFPERLMGDLSMEVKQRLLIQKQVPSSVIDDESPNT